MNVNDLGQRYVVELGGVEYDQRGYLRLGRYSDGAGYSKWSTLRNATQFITEYGARQSAEQSGLDGMKVVIRCNAFDEYLNTQHNRPWVWENKGSL